MAAKGWNDTSIDEITREAGVSRGLVSYHFKDKADLLSSMLAHCEEAFSSAIAEAASRASDPLEQYRLGVRTALNYVQDDPAVYEIFLHFTASGRSTAELGEQIRKLYRGFRVVTTFGIRKGQEEGVFRNDIEPAAAAARHIGAITGLALQWLLDPGAFPFADAARQTEEMLVSYMVTGPRNVARKQPSLSLAGSR